MPRAPRASSRSSTASPGSPGRLCALSQSGPPPRAREKVVVSHIPAFAGELSEQVIRFSGYTLTAGRDGIVTKRSIQNEPAIWIDSPASEAPPVEIAFTVGETRFYGLLIDDPIDTQIGYDTLLIATGRDAREIKNQAQAGAGQLGGERIWSEPIAVKSSGNQDTKTYFRLFDLKPDGSDFSLLHTPGARPNRDRKRQFLPAPRCGLLSATAPVFSTIKAHSVEPFRTAAAAAQKVAISKQSSLRSIN